MSISEIILYPGTKVCAYYGVNPEGEGALIRWMINTLIYLVISLTVVWMIVV